VPHNDIAFDVNGEPRTVRAHPMARLLDVLREELRLTGTKEGCGEGECGACSVLVDGESVQSCVAPVESFVGRRITTAEGIGAPGRLDPLQQAFLDEQAAQCGYCIPGIVVAARALLDQVPHASDDQIRAALAPHLCRCGSHAPILRAVRKAASA
jgi:nicotinate dehydrogenase subunit A